MDVHFGIRAKSLVENYYKGSKKEFAEALKLKHPKYLFEIFKKEDLGTDILKKMSKILNIRLSEFFVNTNEISIVEEPKNAYGKKESEILKTLRQTVKAQEETITSQKITIEVLQKVAGPQMEYTNTAQKK